MGILIFPFSSYALFPDSIFSHLQGYRNYDKETPDELTNEGQRDPGLTTDCTITLESGVQFDSPVFGIISYEIWDADETVCIASYSYEFDFINHLFSLPEGGYTIVFKTYDTIYSGFVTL